MIWRKYPNLRAWIVGRILYHPASPLPASRLAKPPGYILATELDVDDALRALRSEGIIAASSKRWLRNRRAALKIGKPLPRAPNDA